MIQYVKMFSIAWIGVLVLSCAAPGGRGELVKRDLKYAPVTAANPLKGLVPYVGVRNDVFPHSMEFQYVSLNSLVVGKEQYDWAPLEKLLNGVSSRGRQTVFRVFLEMPTKNGIPEYLLKGGLKVTRWDLAPAGAPKPKFVDTPNYADPNLRECLVRFIAAFGAKYDGDPRIGAIEVGLLGTWGEWHDCYHGELWAGSKQIQAAVLDAYEAAFKKTHVLARYPAGNNHPEQTPNASRPFGYHDDSFAWLTLATGRREDAWSFIPQLKRAGPEALDKWKTHPIGGEIRPEAWGEVFDEKPAKPEIQDFATCVEQTHASWMRDSGIFRDAMRTPARVDRALKLAARMGYEFYASSVTTAIDGKTLTVEVTVENRGVAPFYYDWPVEYALLSAKGVPVKTSAGKGKLVGLLPGDPARVWKEAFDTTGIPPGRYQLALRVPNTMPGGLPVRFANETQDQHAPGWLTLGPVGIIP